MNKITPLILALSLIFASCSSNENEGLINTQENLLKSYTLKRDANGAYSIDFNTTNNTDVTTVKNTDASNKIILSEANYKTADNHSNNFAIENDQLKIGFLDANKGKNSQILVEDENITLAKGDSSSNLNYLSTYTINVSSDGTYKLDFEVADKIKTKFIFNEEINTYEVHLSEDLAPLSNLTYNGNIEEKNDFSITLNIPSGEKLNLNFVNHYKLEGKGMELMTYYIEEKPRTSVDI